MVWLAGGPSTIDMWDLKPDAPDEIRGDFRPIATRLEGVSICEHLPLLAGIMNRVTLVRSLTHEINDHSVGSRYLMTGNRPSTSTEFPSLGSVASRMLPGQAGVPSYVSMAEARAPGKAPVSWETRTIRSWSKSHPAGGDNVSISFPCRRAFPCASLTIAIICGCDWSRRSVPRIVLSYRGGSTRFISRQWTSFDRIRSPAPRPVFRAGECAGAVWGRPERSRGPRGAG